MRITEKTHPNGKIMTLKQAEKFPLLALGLIDCIAAPVYHQRRKRGNANIERSVIICRDYGRDQGKNDRECAFIVRFPRK